MEIHQLRYFCAVARTASFTRAAEREHIAQPSLSQQIRKLEEELGSQLFDRLGRAVRLTTSGQALLPRAEEILRRLSEARLEVQECSNDECGKLVVGSIPTIAPYYLPSCLSDFSRNYPGVAFRVVEEITRDLLERVHQGTVDLAIVALPLQGEHGSRFELFRERLYLVVPENHRLASAQVASLEEVADDPFLLLKDGHCFRQNTLSACARARIKPNVVFESGHFASILAMAAAGAGVSVVPEMAVEPQAHCCFIPLADEKAIRRVAVVQTKQHFRSRAHRAFLKYLRARHQAKMAPPLRCCPVETIRRSIPAMALPATDKVPA
jgi:LysR family hydrogen peroxide-inducible transcriptional activator